MNDPASDAKDDSRQALVNAWNLASEPARDRRVDQILQPNRPDDASELHFVVPPPAEAGPSHTDGSTPDFSIHAKLDADRDESHDGAGAGSEPTPRPTVTLQGKSGRSSHDPKAGDTVAGFRILSELGRGAFATVFLAEQLDLARRLVALKVSQAIGDEPQILARLQHTHIVPIHSVHDDPETGLRLLCMPYLGGANLAEVLKTAGARLPSHATGKSLVEALDKIGNRLLLPDPSNKSQSHIGRVSSVARASLLRRGSAAARSTDGPEGRGIGAATRGISSPSRVRSIWGRYWARMPWGSRLEAYSVARGPELDLADGGADLELAQPARRYLGKASYVQAAVWIAARLAEALEHAHARGLLHRDMKPTNILIAADGTPMLLDFNLSAESDGFDAAEGTKAMLGGTLPYMAPEHLDAFNPLGSTPPEAVDERSDIYALGLILFEMVAGQHPFSDPPACARMTDTLAMMTRERQQGAPSLRAAFPEVPWSLDAILKKCLDPEPGRRYLRARDLAEDLRRFLDDLPLKHTSEPSLRERLAKWARRNPRAGSSASVATLSVGLILVLGVILSAAVDRLQGASARLHRTAFHNVFDECQLLLNTTSGPPEHLSRGIDRAQQALSGYGIGQREDWTSGFLVRLLPSAERDSLREEASELTLLLARAREFQAERLGDEHDRQQALGWAITWLNLAEQFDPHPSAALYHDRAQYYAALGQAKEAAHDRAQRDLLPQRTSRDFYLMGTSALAYRKLDVAETDLLKSVERDPRRFWGWFSLGLCHADQKRYLEAAGDFNVCTALAPAFSWPHLNRGLALAHAGRLGDARAAYDRALALNPRFVEALVNRGLVCLELNDARQAARDLDQVIELGRRDPALRAARAEASARLGHRDEARSDFDELVQSYPDDPALRVARGFFLLADPALSEAARSDFARALELAPRNARAHLGLAHLLRRTDTQGALKEASVALDADPQLVDALELRALLRARLGDTAAVADVDRLLQIPSAHRLYNAACALSLLSRSVPDPHLAPRAVALLRRALHGGMPRTSLMNDDDLIPLRALPEFRALVGPGVATLK
jgi:serine/threonine protein kinase/Tfp pilus assembly protein PilF